jgi:hypothetical protein
MVRIDVHHEVAPVQVAIAIELDVQNYEEIATKEAGRVAGFLSGLGLVRSRVDAEIHDRVKDSVLAGLDKQLRPDLIARLEKSVTDSIRGSLESQLAENGVQADVQVSVAAR